MSAMNVLSIGAVDHFDFTDPDGNVLSMYSEID